MFCSGGKQTYMAPCWGASHSGIGTRLRPGVLNVRDLLSGGAVLQSTEVAMAPCAHQSQDGAASRNTHGTMCARSTSHRAQQKTHRAHVCCTGRPLFLSHLPAAMLTSETCGGRFWIVVPHEPYTDQRAAESLASMRASHMS